MEITKVDNPTRHEGMAVCTGIFMLAYPGKPYVDSLTDLGRLVTDVTANSICVGKNSNQVNLWYKKSGLNCLGIPIIISDTDIVSTADDGHHSRSVYNTELNQFGFCTPTRANKKVLVLPHNFSTDLIKDIVAGKLKHDDRVIVECYRRGINSEGYDADLTGGIILHKSDYWCVRFDKKKHATIISQNKSETWDDIFIKERLLFTDDIRSYLKNNYNPPTRK